MNDKFSCESFVIDAITPVELIQPISFYTKETNNIGAKELKFKKINNVGGMIKSKSALKIATCSILITASILYLINYLF